MGSIKNVTTRQFRPKKQKGDCLVDNVHFICWIAKSRKYISKADIKPEKHAPSVYVQLIETKVKSKRHLPYTLKGDKVFIFFSSETSKLLFKGKESASKPALRVSNQLSIERNQPVASTSEATRNRLQRQSQGSWPAIRQLPQKRM